MTGDKFDIRTAILVDGGFYRKRAAALFGPKPPKESAEELVRYCLAHLYDKYENRRLYRIFYYDCPPVDKNVFNPITNKSINLGKSDSYIWMNEFIKELKHQRKFALRMGRLSENQIYYNLKYDTTKKLLNGSLKVDELTLNDFELNIEQKGVDMKIGVDISSLAYKKQVEQIILIAGDSDFVPAAKQARREGIDFILDPMASPIKNDLFEHIDGIRSQVKKFAAPKKEEQPIKDPTDRKDLCR